MKRLQALMLLLVISSLLTNIVLIYQFREKFRLSAPIRPCPPEPYLKQAPTRPCPTERDSKQEDSEKLSTLLTNIGKSVNNAQKHARGMKTRFYLKEATNALRLAFSIFGMNYKNITNPQSNKSRNICPEKFMGTIYGYSTTYDTGFVTTNCTFSTPLSKLLTIVIVGSIDQVNKMLLSVQKYAKGVKTIVSINEEQNETILESKFKNVNVSIIQHGSSRSYGFKLNSLMRLVDTEYVFVSRDTMEFDHYCRFDRLIREIEAQNKPIASGSIRNTINFHWRIGCYQRAFRNYTLVYYEGYDESVHECLICDHVDGPFVMKTELFKTHKFNENISHHGLFEEYFIRIGNEKLLKCPDAMFHVAGQEKSRDVRSWNTFANIINVVRLRFVPGFEIKFPCKKLNNCYIGKYVASPCCLEQLSKTIFLFAEICGKAPVVCEISSGTLLSAVKLNRVFPWDVDADFVYNRANRSILINTANNVKKGFVRLSKGKGFIKLIITDWNVEGFELGKLSSEAYIHGGRNQTLISLNGRWIGVGNNPGLMVRNRFGHRCYQHAVHWSFIGSKTSWMEYNPDTFPKCDTPGNHNCLDLYNTDGNLQFTDPMP